MLIAGVVATFVVILLLDIVATIRVALFHGWNAP
jgi:hypothetical protein